MRLSLLLQLLLLMRQWSLLQSLSAAAEAELVTSAMPIRTRVPVAVTSEDPDGYAKLPLRIVTSETTTCALGV